MNFCNEQKVFWHSGVINPLTLDPEQTGGVGSIQMVKFGLRGERVPRAKISGLFSVCAKFFDRPLSAQNFQPVCCVTCAVFKKGLQFFFLPRMEWFQYNPCTFARRLDG